MRNLKAILIAAALLGFGISFMFLPIRDWFAELQGQIKGLGAIGPMVVALAYALMTLLLIPGSALTIGSGTIFGLWTGLLVVIVGSNLGALGSFLLARTFLRNKVAKWAEADPRFAALDRAIGRSGFKMVLLSRLSPVFPFTLLNYLLGLTRVRTSSYLLGNVLGMLPGTFLYVYTGATARDALTGASAGVDSYLLALKIAGLLATIAIVVMLTRTARKIIAER